MSKKKWTITFLILTIALTSFAIYSNYSKSNVEYAGRVQAIQDLVERPDITINVKHQYKDDLHTYLGTFEVPTPCHSYEADLIYEADEIIIDLKYTQSLDSECALVVTDRDFRVSFTGEESDAEFVIAKLNGNLVNLNIFEVPKSQNIDDFQIYIKG